MYEGSGAIAYNHRLLVDCMAMIECAGTGKAYVSMTLWQLDLLAVTVDSIRVEQYINCIKRS